MMRLLAMTLTTFLLFLGSVSAFECAKLDSSLQEDCAYVNRQDILAEEKELLISNLMNAKSYTPDHETVYNWNTQLSFASPPEGVAATNSKWITNSWLALVAVMPSILDNETLYVPTEVKALSAHNYEIKPPENYKSPFYPLTKQGSCRIDYTPESESSKVEVNGKEGNIALLNITSDSTITSKLIITAKYKAAHHKWKKYCAKWGERGCLRWAYKCEYRNTQTEQDTVTLTDSKQVKLYRTKPFANLTILDNPRGAYRIQPVIGDETSAVFSFDSGFLKHTGNFYTFDYSYPPYYVMTLRSENNPQDSSSGLITIGDDYLVKTNSCFITSWTHFETNTTSCDLGFDKEPLRIKTNKVFYEPNETIKVSIQPDDENVTVEYANQIVLVKGSTEFTAMPLNSQIIVSDGIRESYTVVHVKDEDNFVFVAKMVVFGAIAYFGYIFTRNMFTKAISGEI